MEFHFLCTACGKCCFGWLPLTLKDALTHAGRFPLAVIWTPVKPASKAYDITAKLGLATRTLNKKRLAVRIAPTAYIPPSLPCPALNADNLCEIHSDKPSRCRTMPFSPYREESDQRELLVPRPGWACATSPEAPVVYRDKTPVDRDDFDRECRDLIAQAPILRTYGEWLLATVPGMIENLGRAAAKPRGGHMAVSFASLLRRLGDVDKPAIAEAQLAVLGEFASKVADQPALAEYSRNYSAWAWEMERLTRR
ncbi:MAG: YkgJ family cysteine cluster protein [Rhodospirillales bacterium]|nr:YkgJ family cysteine cluster protein [Rhodospirillales bacterium]